MVETSNWKVRDIISVVVKMFYFMVILNVADFFSGGSIYAQNIRMVKTIQEQQTLRQFTSIMGMCKTHKN